MNYLLDTHIAVWATSNHKKLSYEFISEINDLNNKIYVSMLSVWEIAIKNIKHGYERMPMDEKQFVRLCKELEFDFLPINTTHIFNIRNVKLKNNNIIHKDPFDKLLISQSICENLILCTRDTVLLNYDSENIRFV